MNDGNCREGQNKFCSKFHVGEHFRFLTVCLRAVCKSMLKWMAKKTKDLPQADDTGERAFAADEIF